jgi:hypothetical protein
MSFNSNLRLSQDYEVLRPKNGKLIPVPCSEWDVLKRKIEGLAAEPWIFHTAGSILVGAALATAISVWTGAVSTAAKSNSIVVAWAVTSTCGVTGLACMYFAVKERDVHRSKANDVVTQMDLIEQRFERD